MPTILVNIIFQLLFQISKYKIVTNSAKLTVPKIDGKYGGFIIYLTLTDRCKKMLVEIIVKNTLQ